MAAGPAAIISWPLPQPLEEPAKRQRLCLLLCPRLLQRYKEKLSSKCFREYNNKLKFSDSLNSQHWRFLKSGLDDFRNGFPPPSNNIIIRGTKGPFPVILHKDTPQASSMAQEKARKPLNKHPRKLNPLQKYGRDYVAEAKHCSSQYPLLLYPHLKGSVSSKLFQEVVAVLDPKMCLSFEPGYRDHGQESHGLQKEKSPLKDGQRKETIPAPKSSAPSKESKDKNPYIWFSKKKTTAREKAARLQYVPPLDENVKQVTKEFCDWASSLGGDKHSIEEDTLTSLFDTAYETHPTISVPVQVVEINNVPPELKRCLGVSSSRTAVKSPLKDPYQPKSEKIKYGAWYLDPKTWKKQKANEPLMDPKATIDDFQQLRKQFCEKEAEVMQLHGTHAFKEFLERKGYRKPEVRHGPEAKQCDRQTLKAPKSVTSKGKWRNECKKMKTKTWQTMKGGRSQARKAAAGAGKKDKEQGLFLPYICK